MNVEDLIIAHLQSKTSQAGQPADITTSTDLIGEGVEDSLGIFTLIAFLEEQFHVHVEPEDVTLDNFETVGSIAALVKRKLEDQEKSA